MSDFENESDVSKALDESVGIYIRRFEESLGEARLFERLFFSVDIPKLMNDTPEGAKTQVLKALKSLLGNQGYAAYKFGITFIWAEVEAFIDDFLKSWLKHVVSPATLDIFDKIKINESIRAYEKLSSEEVNTLHVKLLKEHIRRAGDSEVRVFFKALDALGLKSTDGNTEKALLKLLTEMQQLRNVLVHRGGLVNRGMFKACPWLELDSDIELGKRFPLNSEASAEYGVAAINLVTHVLERVNAFNENILS